MSKTQPNQANITLPLVTRLVAEQFPQWANLPLTKVDSAGTDHIMYRLGDAMVVRLPRISNAAEQVVKEQTWLAKLAPQLPLTIPTPLAQGVSGAGFPFPWSIYPWIDGETALLERISAPTQTAQDLAYFLRALQQIDTDNAPLPGTHNFYRGVPLTMRDAQTRYAIQGLQGVIDTEAASVAWDKALHAPAWKGSPVWIHGDLQSGNLLVADGKLRAVIDFGGLCVGDPACDLMVAWTLFSAEMRPPFRAALQPDDATWQRGRGWALSFGVTALEYHIETNLTLAGIARYTIEQVLSEHSIN